METPPPYDETIFAGLEINFPGFWTRFGAATIDGLILMAIYLPLNYFNAIDWKSTFLFTIITLICIVYKPFMEYRFGATIGKMACGILVVGKGFQKVSLPAELRRVSFYMIPTILQGIFTLPVYFSDDFQLITGYRDYNHLVQANSAITWINIIVFALLIVDGITFLADSQNRSLHDKYGDTYVIFKSRSYAA